MPRVSILLPVHNGARFLKQAVSSIQNQRFADWELVIVDDGSTDETSDFVRESQKDDTRIRSIRNAKNLGIQKSLNKGLEAARGEYIARIDDDDRWIDPEKLQKQVAFLDSHREYALVGTGAAVVDESGKELSRFLNPGTDDRIRARILGKNCFTHSSVLFRTDAAREAGGYRENTDVLHVEDYDLWLRLGLKHRFANLPIYGIAWTMRESGLGSRNKLVQFRNGLRLSWQYRRAYPNARAGLVRHILRIKLYCVFRLIPGRQVRAAILDTWVRFFKRAL